MSSVFRVALLVLLLVLLTGAQNNPHPQPPPRPGARMPEMDIPPAMRHQMDRQLNLERQQSLKKDTDQLYQLATELKQAVDKSNENVLSIDVIRKAEQIEKLAKQVKNKMKG